MAQTVATVNQVAGTSSYTPSGMNNLVFKTPQIAFNSVPYFDATAGYVANPPVFRIAERDGNAIQLGYGFDISLRYDNPDAQHTNAGCRVDWGKAPTMNLLPLIDPVFTPTASQYSMNIVPPVQANPTVQPESGINMPSDATRGVRDATTASSGQLNPGTFQPVLRVYLTPTGNPGTTCAQSAVDFVYLPITVDNVRPLLTSAVIPTGPGSATTIAKVGDTVTARVRLSETDNSVNASNEVGQITHPAITNDAGTGVPKVRVAKGTADTTTFTFKIKEASGYDGTINLPVAVNDTAGNVQTINLPIRIDSVSPTPTIPTGTVFPNGSIKFTWGAGELDNDVVKWNVVIKNAAGTIVKQVDLAFPGAQGTTPTSDLVYWFDRPTQNFADGQYFLTLQGTDDAGNVGPAITSAGLYSDLTAPVLTLVAEATKEFELANGAPARGATAFNLKAVNGTVSDAGSGVDAVYVRILSSNAINPAFGSAGSTEPLCWRGEATGAVADMWKPCFNASFWSSGNLFPGGYVKLSGTTGAVTGTGPTRTFTLSATPDKMPSPPPAAQGQAPVQGQFKVSLLARDLAYAPGREAQSETRVENLTYVIDKDAPTIPSGTKWHAQRVVSTPTGPQTDAGTSVRQGVDKIRFELKDGTGAVKAISDGSGILDATLYLSVSPPSGTAPRVQTVHKIPVEWAGTLSPGLYTGTPRVGLVPSVSAFVFDTALLPVGDYVAGQLVVRDLAGNAVTYNTCTSSTANGCLFFGSLTTALIGTQKGFQVAPRASFEDFNATVANAAPKFLRFFPNNNTLNFHIFTGYNNRTSTPDHASRVGAFVRTLTDSRAVFGGSGSFLITPEKVEAFYQHSQTGQWVSIPVTTWPPDNPGGQGTPQGAFRYKVAHTLTPGQNGFDPNNLVVRVNVTVGSGAARYVATIEERIGNVPAPETGKPSLKINSPAPWFVSHNGTWRGDVSLTVPATSAVGAHSTDVALKVWRVDTTGLTQADLAALSADPVSWVNANGAKLTSARAADSNRTFSRLNWDSAHLNAVEWFNDGSPTPKEAKLPRGLYILETRLLNSGQVNTTTGDLFTGIALSEVLDRKAVVFSVETNKPTVTVNTADDRNNLFDNGGVFYTERNVTVVVDVDTGYANLTGSPKSSRNPGAVNPIPVYVKLVKNTGTYSPKETGANRLQQQFVVYNVTESREATAEELAGNDKFLQAANRSNPTATSLGKYTLAIRFQIPAAIPDNERFDFRVLAVNNAGELFAQPNPEAARTSPEVGNDVEFDSAAPVARRYEGPSGTNATLRTTSNLNQGKLVLQGIDTGAGAKNATVSLYRLTGAGLVENWTGSGGWRVGVAAEQYNLPADTNGGRFELTHTTSNNVFGVDGALFKSGNRIYYVRVHMVDNLSNAADYVVPISVDSGAPSVVGTPGLGWVRPADRLPGGVLKTNAHATFLLNVTDDLPANVARAELRLHNPHGETYVFPATGREFAGTTTKYSFNLSNTRALWWSGDYEVSFRVVDAVGNTLVHVLKDNTNKPQKFTVADTQAPVVKDVQLFPVGSDVAYRKNAVGQSIVDGTSAVELRVTVEENTALSGSRDAWFLLGATNQKYGPYTLTPVEGQVSARNGSGVYRVDLSSAPRSGPAMPARQDGQLWNVTVAFADTGKNAPNAVANKLTETKVGAFYVFNNLAPVVERLSPSGTGSPVIIRKDAAISWRVVDVNTPDSGITLRVSRDGGASRDETANLTIARPGVGVTDRWTVTWTPKNLVHGTRLQMVLTATDSLLNTTTDQASFAVDAAAPTVAAAFEGPTVTKDGKVFVGPATLLKLTATDADPSVGGLTVFYKLPGDATFRTYTAPFPVPADAANPGALRTVTFYAQDAAGNKGLEDVRAVVVDDRIPTATMVAVGNEGDRAVRIRATDAGAGVAPERVALHLRTNRDNVPGSYQAIPMTPGSDGAFTGVIPDSFAGPVCYYVTVEDLVGNVGGPGTPRLTAERPYCFTLPNRVPEVDFTAPAVDRVLRGPFTATWTVSDPDGDALSIVLALEGSDTFTLPGPITGTSYTVDPRNIPGLGAVPDGDYQLVIRVEDGNNALAVDRVPITLVNAPVEPTPVTNLPPK
ncbi:MAG TPA: hypothetical protein VNZ52_01085, partial [Candidatus Thermoplasmatota archaeon]|nr:hypothetical protein [Candidatus Thermoplasmatota archaeon]